MCRIYLESFHSRSNDYITFAIVIESILNQGKTYQYSHELTYYLILFLHTNETDVSFVNFFFYFFFVCYLVGFYLMMMEGGPGCYCSITSVPHRAHSNEK